MGTEKINFRGLVNSPLNREGVFFLFGMVAPDLNISVTELRADFPSVSGERFTGQGWEKVRIEIEYKSGDFKQRGHDPAKCDLLVCWENDWPECPVEVIDLRDRIRSLPATPAAPPDAGFSESLERLFDRMKVNDNIRDLFRSFDRQIKDIDEEIWAKVAKTSVIYFSPGRAFLYAFPKPKIVNFQLFTGSELIEGVREFKDQPSASWGYINLDFSNIQITLDAIKTSFRLMKEAIKKNEPSGDYSPKADG